MVDMNKKGWYPYLAYNYMKWAWRIFCGSDAGRRFVKNGFPLDRISRYAGKRVLGEEETNSRIAQMISSGEPFMVCRFGGNELHMVESVLRKRHFPYQDTREAMLTPLCSNAGFFPEDVQKAEQFADLMLDCCKDIDLCGIWRLFMEDYILKSYAPSAAQITLLSRLEPWKYKRPSNASAFPWSHALKGKRVLVIHPFADTIRRQYELKREAIFKRIYDAGDILPAFDLQVIKAVQTINGTEKDKYADWFEALEEMTEKCASIDFDIALIGCGAYGFPLAAAVKRMGKGAVHLGGALQLMFGIRGRRWEGENSYMEKSVMNEAWVRPSEKEIPVGADQIENSCYW